jgi:tRNA nucleotidyltransferase (CCA-adding enzyme)
VLRVARFAARFAPLGFTIAAETLELMGRIVATGELAALVPERVWVETDRALGEARPRVYFEVLRQCGALAAVFPEIERLFGVPQPPKWHPEIDTGEHTLQVLEVACELSDDRAVRFAALVHDLGKGVTPPSEWPRHIGHEHAGVRVIQQLCERLKVPTELRELGMLVSREHQRVHRAARTARRDRTGTARGDRRIPASRAVLKKLLLACEADARGRGPELRRRDYAQADMLRRCREAAAAVKLDDDLLETRAGPAIARALRAARAAAIGDVRRNTTR